MPVSVLKEHDVAEASEVAQLVRRGAGFEVILLGGSTSARIDLADLALLSAMAPETPILVTAECDDAEAAREILRSGARGFLPTSLCLRVLMGALERMRLYPYDLLIADLKMPGMDGLTVIREAKRYKADLPVIIITGFSTESSAIEAVNLGVAGYLTKPFRVPQVLAAAAKALGE
jgi:DNA-binding NarL/FixJ family response regulator